VTRAGWIRDGLLAVVLVAGAFAPPLAHNGVELGELPARPLDGLGVALALAQCVPLVFRRRWPVACLAVVAPAFAAHQLLGYAGTISGLGLLVALYSVAVHQERFRRQIAVVATVAYVGLAVALHGRGSPERPVDFVTFYAVPLVCWAVGSWMRARTKAEADRRRLTAELAVADERARIARELHDVVTHHVTAMVVQSDAAQFAPAQAGDSLAAIGDTGRQALAELRFILGVLDGGGPPQLEDLVERTRSAGQPVELAEEGEPQPLPGAVELAAYRVVQEALTNALKHAPGRRTVVRVRYGPSEIDIDVTNDGPSGAASLDGGGRGLAGVRERVGGFGGDLSAGRRPDGGFTVRARIPVGSTR
jgi:signal transduction histidine kinase